jgi:protein phosphatase
MVAEQIRNGLLTESEASDHPYRRLITRHFAGHLDVDIDVFDVALRPDDAVVLCSDGVHAVVSDQEIGRTVAQGGVFEAADAIVRLARERETADDACVVVVGRGQPEEPTIRIGLPHRRSVLMLAGGLLLVAAIAIFQSGRGPPATSPNTAVAGEADDAPESEAAVVPADGPTWVVETPTPVDPAPTSTLLPPPTSAVAAIGSISSPTPAATLSAILGGLASPPPESATPTVGVNPTRRPATVTSKAATRTAKSPARPTGTPTPVYPPPVLRPAEVASGAVALGWTYAGQLAADEYFDVRVWANGQPANGIANVKQPSYVIGGSFPAGTYSWTIAVVRRTSDGTVLTVASAGQALSFTWSGPVRSGS